MTVALRNHEVLFTFDDFVRMADDGYFGDAEHLELIDGRIFSLSPVSLHHTRGQSRLWRALDRALCDRLMASGAEVVGPSTLQIDALNAPEFDAAIVNADSERDYLRTMDVLLVAEVMLSSRSRDLRSKPSLYAAAGVPEYWVADRRNKRLHVFRRPTPQGYQERLDPLEPGETIATLAVPDIAIPVADLL